MQQKGRIDRLGTYLREKWGGDVQKIVQRWYMEGKMSGFWVLGCTVCTVLCGATWLCRGSWLAVWLCYWKIFCTVCTRYVQIATPNSARLGIAEQSVQTEHEKFHYVRAAARAHTPSKGDGCTMSTLNGSHSMKIFHPP